MGMTDANLDQRPIQFLPPELKKFPEDRKMRRHIIFLPDEGLEKMRVIRKSVQNLRRCQSVTRQLPHKLVTSVMFSRHRHSHRLAKGAFAAGLIAPFHAQ